MLFRVENARVLRLTMLEFVVMWVKLSQMLLLTRRSGWMIEDCVSYIQKIRGNLGREA